MEDEVELRSCRVAVLELHLATDVAVRARASGDGEDAVTSVVERALDRDLPGRQEGGPRAFPRFAHDSADTGSLVATDLPRVGRIEDVVREREDVAGVVSRGSVGDGIGGRVLDHRDRATRGGVTTLAVAGARVHRDHQHSRSRQERECDYPLHLYLLLA